jgi:hypothetical protein
LLRLRAGRIIEVLMTTSLGDRRWRRVAALGVALYALFLVTAPFSHHDLACHLKTPEHCTACASSTLASGPRASVVPEISHLAEAGRPATLEMQVHSALLAPRSSGRSPPSAS